MTSPQPTEQGLSEGEQEALAALTTAIAEGALIGAIALPPYLYSKLLKLGFDPKAIKAASRLALPDPLGRRRTVTSPGPRVAGTAAAQVASAEAEWRARYLLAAARRITSALRHGANLFTALRQERRFYDMHRNAGKRRAAAAREVDRIVEESGSEWLRWTLGATKTHTPGCVWADGQIFTRDQPLVFTDDDLPARVQWPGTPHPRCGCVAVPVFAHSPLLVTATR